MGLLRKSLLLCVLWSLAAPALGSNVSVEINDEDFSTAPPDDLVYRGQRIDAAGALELKKQGVDLSRLNPRKSHLWSDAKLAPDNRNAQGYPDSDATLSFIEFKSSPSEIFRSTVEIGGERFVLTASLDNHTNILRAGLLRLMGYDVDMPRYYQDLRVRFEDKEQREKFVELAGEETLTNRERWVKDREGETVLRVKGFTLEPAELRNVNIYLPVMSRSRQAGRRVFRALLNVYVLTDFPQNINAAAWERGRQFNNSLIFNHPYASEFSSVAVEDMRWAHRRLARLERAEYSAVLAAAGLPQDVAALYLEKLLSRVNYLGELLETEEQKFSVDRLVSVGNVSRGKLTKNDYQDGYVVEFYREDELSPYRFWELFRLFKTQLTYSGLSSALDTAMEKFVPGLRVENAIEDIQGRISDYRADNPSLNGAMPLKAFAAPLASGRAFANRNVVFGQYLGSDAPIQLVDTAGAEASLGVFSNIAGVAEGVVPSASAQVSLGRTYTHVRAMPDLQSATSQEVKKLLIPGHFKSLARVIQDEYQCGVPESPYKEEATFNGEKILYVKYDPSWENARERALKKRQELIEGGAEETILLRRIDREKLCGEEVSETRSKHLEEFLKQFAMNEMFIVSDTVRLGAKLNAPIPFASSGSASATMSLTGESSVALLRSVMARRTETGMELTVQYQKDLKNSFSQGLSYFIELVNNSSVWTKGDLMSKVYKIPLEQLDENQTKTALKALRALFANNDRGPIEKNYRPVDLDHDVSARLNTFRLLFFKSERLKMSHQVDVVVPNREGRDFGLEERTRSFYAVSDMKRRGKDFYSFMDRTLSSLTGFLGLGSGSADPGRTFMGSSTKTNIVTETELTPGRDAAPTTRAEFVWTGWNKKAWEMNDIFNQIENIFGDLPDGPLIKRSILYGYENLKSYEARASIILYPEALDRATKTLFRSTALEAVGYMRHMYGKKKWDSYCRNAANAYGENGPHILRLDPGQRVCAPPPARRIMSLRSKGVPKGRKALAKFNNALAAALFKGFRPAAALRLLGKDVFFATVRVRGFRESAPEGMLDYISNSVGNYNNEYGTGVFDAAAGHLNISPYELRAMMYTPSM